MMLYNYGPLHAPPCDLTICISITVADSLLFDLQSKRDGQPLSPGSAAQAQKDAVLKQQNELVQVLELFYVLHFTVNNMICLIGHGKIYG